MIHTVLYKHNLLYIYIINIHKGQRVQEQFTCIDMSPLSSDVALVRQEVSTSCDSARPLLPPLRLSWLQHRSRGPSREVWPAQPPKHPQQPRQVIQAVIQNRSQPQVPLGAQSQGQLQPHKPVLLPVPSLTPAVLPRWKCSITTAILLSTRVRPLPLSSCWGA